MAKHPYPSSYFTKVKNDACESGIKYFKLELYSSLKDLTLSQQLKMCVDLIVDIEGDKLALESKVYLKFNENKERLIQYFNNRSLVLKLDDTQNLFTGIYWAAVFVKLKILLIELYGQIPNYSYRDFLNGEKNEILLNLNLVHEDNLEDKRNIQIWQRENAVSIIKDETSNVIQSLQSYYLSIDYPYKSIKKDLDHYYTQIKGVEFVKLSQLVSAYQKLSFMKGYDFAKFNSERILEEVNDINKNGANYNYVFPSTVKLCNEYRKAKNDNGLYSVSPIVFISVLEIIKWLDVVFNMKKINTPYSIDEHDKAFNIALEETYALAKGLNQEYELSSSYQVASNELKVTFIYDELEKLRRALFDIEESLEQANNANKEKMSSKPTKDNKIFFEVILIETRIKLYLDTLLPLAEPFKTIDEYRQVVPEMIDDVANTFCKVICHPEVYIYLDNLIENSINPFIKGGLPFFLVIRSFNERVYKAFRDCIEFLLQYLEKLGSDISTIYIQTKLRELKMEGLQDSPYSDQKQSFFSSQLEKYLEIQSDFIKETKHLDVRQSLPEKKKGKKVLQNVSFSFGFKQRSSEILLAVIHKLCREFEMLDEDRTSATQFVHVLTASNVNSGLPEVHFKMQTKKVVFVFEKLKPFFHRLTAARMEKSNLFFTDNKNPLKAANYYSSKRGPLPVEHEKITKIIRGLE